MSLVLGASSNGSGTSASAPTVNLSWSTHGANSLVMAHISISTAGSLVTVSSLSDNAGNTWHKLDSQNWQNSGTNTNFCDQEIWYTENPSNFPSGTLTLTITMSGTCSTWGCFMGAWTGYTAGSPFDPNGSLPVHAHNATSTSSNVQVTGFTTTNADDVLMGFYAEYNSGASLLAAQTGFTLLTAGSVFAGSGANTLSSRCEYDIVSATQSSLTVYFGAPTANAYWGMMGYAITADASGDSAAIAMTMGQFTMDFEAYAGGTGTTSMTMPGFTQEMDVFVGPYASIAMTMLGFKQTLYVEEFGPAGAGSFYSWWFMGA